ncbi:MAG: nucleoside-diphosphate kinase [Candidatus Saccharibacteria bacterium]
MEKTLIVLKPDTVQRGLVGEIITRFEKVGLKIVGMKMVSPSKEHYHRHYEEIGKMITRRGQDKFDWTLDTMMLGPVVAVVLEGIEAISLVRKMVGDTEPKSSLPGTIRGDYSHISYGHADKHQLSMPNIIHASGDTKDSKAEVAHWFKSSELFNYETVHEKFTLRTSKHK